MVQHWHKCLVIAVCIMLLVLVACASGTEMNYQTELSNSSSSSVEIAQEKEPDIPTASDNTDNSDEIPEISAKTEETMEPLPKQPVFSLLLQNMWENMLFEYKNGVWEDNTGYLSELKNEIEQKLVKSHYLLAKNIVLSRVSPNGERLIYCNSNMRYQTFFGKEHSVEYMVSASVNPGFFSYSTTKYYQSQGPGTYHEDMAYHFVIYNVLIPGLEKGYAEDYLELRRKHMLTNMALSPDDEMLIFYDGDYKDFYVFNLATRDLMLLKEYCPKQSWNKVCRECGIHWFPGNKLIYSSSDVTHTCYIYDIETQSVVSLGDGIFYPILSEDTKYAAFCRLAPEEYADHFKCKTIKPKNRMEADEYGAFIMDIQENSFVRVADIGWRPNCFFISTK